MHMHEEEERDHSMDITPLFWHKNSKSQPSKGLEREIELCFLLIYETRLLPK